jgi:hypothetical protein
VEDVVEQVFWVQPQQMVDQAVDLEAMVVIVALLDWGQLVKDLLVHLGLEQLELLVQVVVVVVQDLLELEVLFQEVQAQQ